tara:strand:- start:227 stop:829 length:603 start_codon:yes stop_codon:yes gene_type:complete
MLGLGSNICNNDVVSGVVPGYFQYTIPSTTTDVTRILLQAHNIAHANDTNANDDDPGILLSNFKIEYNGSEFSYNFNQAYAAAGNAIYGTVTASGNSLSFAETQIGPYVFQSQSIYSDSTTDFSSLQAGGKLKLSGVVTLNDGTGNLYVPNTSSNTQVGDPTTGRIDFLLSNTNPPMKVGVYIWPDYSSFLIGSTKVQKG